MDSDNVILKIEDLNLQNSRGEILVEHFSLTLHPGETLGLVGESGSGKTMTLRSIIGLLPNGVRESCKYREIAGNCAMIFQNPVSALDPLCPVFRQLTEIVKLRQSVKGQEAKAIAGDLLKKLSLPESLMKHDRYPGELSGGQCQRIVIAMALACRPDILLCDEPTTALDVTVQKQTIQMIRELQEEMGFAMIFVTHNLAVAAGLCSSLYVMRSGKVIEKGSTEQILHQPEQSYTRVLLDSVLKLPRITTNESCRYPGKEK